MVAVESPVQDENPAEILISGRCYQRAQAGRCSAWKSLIQPPHKTHLVDAQIKPPQKEDCSQGQQLSRDRTQGHV